MQKSVPQSLFAGYGHEHAPLAEYAGLTGLFNAAIAGFLIAAKHTGRPLPERMKLSDVLLLGLATHKLSRLATKEIVTSPFRAPFTKYQGPSATPGEVIEKARGTGWQRALGELLT